MHQTILKNKYGYKIHEARVKVGHFLHLKYQSSAMYDRYMESIQVDWGVMKS
jgi:hypothetical protein